MIGVMSDSHDNLVKTRRAMSLFGNASCDLIIHAGDVVAPFALRELRAAGVPVKAVFGNCDGERAGLAKALEGWGEIQEAPLIVLHQGRRIIVTHLDSAVNRLLASNPADVIVFGHTHQAAAWQKRGVLRLNPGETGGWLYGKSTVALLDLETLTANIVSLD